MALSTSCLLFTSLLALGVVAGGINDQPWGSSPPWGRIKLNEYGPPCTTSLATWDFVKPDTCIPIKGTDYQSLESVHPWPVCKSGEEAKFAIFDQASGTCDPAKNNNGEMRALKSKSDILFGCTDLRDVGSLSFWCDGAEILEEPVEIDINADQTKDGGVLHFPGKGCRRGKKPEPKYYAPDTCIDITENFGLQLSAPGVCQNGTKAIIAGFAGKNCDPTSKPLKDPFTKWDDRVIGFCLPTDGINSMTFWCDGIEGVDMTKPRVFPKKGGSNLGLIVGLSVGIGSLLFIVLGLVVAYSINYHFRTKVNQLFGKGDGYIAL
ncbi:hypothetical protein BJ875DRAFT_466312 [Amylocarpus encephaloides]|uniref:Uncharacterized protein n=1 Tax=Amylocarpus encephaloides TaxID=45428 RepID=A0A9P7YFC8_9HELO|nr:hypothetical protein BJ875DRAFT_466312 [Amylocarpus encephaloides]